MKLSYWNFRKCASRGAILKKVVPIFIEALVIFFPGCDLQNSDELPTKDWTVERVVYYKNFSTPYYEVYWGGEDNFTRYTYSYQKNVKSLINFSDIVVIPGVPCTGWGGRFSDGFSAYAEGGKTPTGDAVITYYNTYFFEYKGSEQSFGGGDWHAEVRIVTKTMPVTVIE